MKLILKMTDNKKWFNSIFNSSANQDLASRNNHNMNQDNLIHNESFEKKLIVFSPETELLWTYGQKIVQCTDEREKFFKTIDDISVKMKERALNNYGFVCFILILNQRSNSI